MNAVVSTPEQPNRGSTPMEILLQAISSGADLERLRTLMDLQERWEANNARKAYVAAMAAFKAQPIEILKSKAVNIPGGAKFNHATLADVVDGAVATMGRYGLSHNWELSQDASGITVTCVVTHEAGHSERKSLTAPADDSGKKNAIQQIASTVTYLERYTLMAALGLAAKDMDDDARAAGNQAKNVPAPPEGYQDWEDNLRAVIDEGREALLAAWKASPMDKRTYMAKHFAAQWEDWKKRATVASEIAR